MCCAPAIRPLAEAVRVAGDVAAGKLDSALPARSTKWRLLDAMQGMRGQLQSVMAAQAEMARRHDAGELSYRMDAAAFPGEYGRMVADSNQLVASSNAVTSAWWRSCSVMPWATSVWTWKLPGEKAVFTAAMATTAQPGRDQRADPAAGAAAAAGDFAVRGDALRFDHDFRRMVETLNTMMEVSDHNLAALSTLLRAIAAGDLSTRMQGTSTGIRGDARRCQQHRAAADPDRWPDPAVGGQHPPGRR